MTLREKKQTRNELVKYSSSKEEEEAVRNINKKHSGQPSCRCRIQTPNHSQSVIILASSSSYASLAGWTTGLVGLDL